MNNVNKVARVNVTVNFFGIVRKQKTNQEYNRKTLTK